MGLNMMRVDTLHTGTDSSTVPQAGWLAGWLAQQQQLTASPCLWCHHDMSLITDALSAAAVPAAALSLSLIQL